MAKNSFSTVAALRPRDCASRATKSPTPSEDVGPGSTQLTVTPVPARDSASPRATASCAVLVTTRPQLRRRMPGIYWRHRRTPLSTITSKKRRDRKSIHGSHLFERRQTGREQLKTFAIRDSVDQFNLVATCAVHTFGSYNELALCAPGGGGDRRHGSAINDAPDA